MTNPENCGTGFCSCIECVVDSEPAPKNSAACEVGRVWQDCWRKSCDRRCAAPVNRTEASTMALNQTKEQ